MTDRNNQPNSHGQSPHLGRLAISLEAVSDACLWLAGLWLRWHDHQKVNPVDPNTPVAPSLGTDLFKLPEISESSNRPLTSVVDQALIRACCCRVVCLPDRPEMQLMGLYYVNYAGRKEEEKNAGLRRRSFLPPPPGHDRVLYCGSNRAHG